MLLKEFIEKEGLDYSVERDPDGDWRCILSKGDHSLDVELVSEPGYEDEAPDVETLLSIVRETVGMYSESESLEEWAETSENDPDDEETKEVWEDAGQLAAHLKELLGQQAFDDLLYATD